MDRQQQQQPDHHKFFEGEDHSNDYTNFRPKTPEQCIQWIVEYLSEKITQENGTFSSAADIGCGTGNYTNRKCFLHLQILFKLSFNRPMYRTVG